MSISILIITLAFYWLLYETYWLTIRLPHGKHEGFSIASLIDVAISIYIGVNLFPLISEINTKDKSKVPFWYHILYWIIKLPKKLLPPKLPMSLR